MNSPEYYIQYYRSHKEELIKYKKQWYRKNRARILKKRKKYNKKHKQQRKKYIKNYTKLNKKKLQQQAKKYYQKRKEHIKNRVTKYYNQNKNKIIKKQILYTNYRRKNNIKFRLLCNLRKRIWDAVKGNCKSARTMKLIGCSMKELKQHLQKQFKKGMTWENYGKYGWEVDHIRPCATFDLNKVSEQRKCFHYTNLQPLWAEENWSKSDKYTFV